MAVLLEVVAQREVQERPLGRRQLHRRGQAALDDGEVARREVAVQVGDEGADLDARGRSKALRVDAGAGHRDHAQAVDPPRGRRVGGDHAPQQRLAHARSADGHDHDPLVGPVAELAPELLAGLDQRCRVEARDVAAERVVALGPIADVGQVGTEVVGHDVVGLADEDRAVADPREPLDVLDHLRVVVGREVRLALAAGGHRQPAHEVGQPGERGPLELGVLVQVVVHVPRLVADHEVVLALLDRVVEHHEVRDQDLVHAPDGLEGVEVVVEGLVRDVGGLIGELRAERVDRLAV